MTFHVRLFAIALLAVAGVCTGCRSGRSSAAPDGPEPGAARNSDWSPTQEPLTGDERLMDEAQLRHHATMLRVHAIDTLEAAYKTVEQRKGRGLFNLAIRDLEHSQRIYFDLMGRLPAHLQAPLEAEIEQVQKLLRRCYSERPQLPLEPPQGR